MYLKEELGKRNKKFIEDIKKTHPGIFEDLSVGQHPPFLIIGCADSRVSPEIVLDGSLGEFFVHRNIANQANMKDKNFLAVLEYALFSLNIKYIIIKGHSDCGGVRAAYENLKLGFVSKWVKPIKSLYKKNKAFIEELENEEEKISKLAELNVIEQVKNILNSKLYKKARSENIAPDIIGTIFELKSGKLKVII